MIPQTPCRRVPVIEVITEPKGQLHFGPPKTSAGRRMAGLPRFVVDANPKEVAARAGHASVSFTLDRYGHLYPETDVTLRERLDAIWSAGGGGS